MQYQIVQLVTSHVIVTMLKKKLVLVLALAGLGLMHCAGCGGSNKTVLPTDELTEEQKAAIMAEDARIDDEESRGSVNNAPKKKK